MVACARLILAELDTERAFSGPGFIPNDLVFFTFYYDGGLSGPFWGW